MDETTKGGGEGKGTREGGWLRAASGERGRIYPMAIRRVAVIEVIAILCPVSPAVLAVVLFLSRPRPVFSRSLPRTRCQVLRDRITRVANNVNLSVAMYTDAPDVHKLLLFTRTVSNGSTTYPR